MRANRHLRAAVIDARIADSAHTVGAGARANRAAATAIVEVIAARLHLAAVRLLVAVAVAVAGVASAIAHAAGASLHDIACRTLGCTATAVGHIVAAG